MDGIGYIYGVIHPDLKKVCYVGKTQLEIEQRMQSHYNYGKHANATNFDVWYANNLDAGLDCKVITLETVYDLDMLDLAEEYWINRFNLDNQYLLNMQYRGNGNKYKYYLYMRDDDKELFQFIESQNLRKKTTRDVVSLARSTYLPLIRTKQRLLKFGITPTYQTWIDYALYLRAKRTGNAGGVFYEKEDNHIKYLRGND